MPPKRTFRVALLMMLASMPAMPQVLEAPLKAAALFIPRGISYLAGTAPTASPVLLVYTQWGTASEYLVELEIKVTATSTPINVRVKMKHQEASPTEFQPWATQAVVLPPSSAQTVASVDASVVVQTGAKATITPVRIP